MSEIAPLFAHQKETYDFLLDQNKCYDTSDAGTGKTRPHLEAWAERRRHGGKKALVLGPVSILRPAWGGDIDKFTPDIKYSIATAANRDKAFATDADVYITNTDAVRTYLAKKTPTFFRQFDTLIVDESDSFRHHTSSRSKALLKISKNFEYASCLTGTPYNKSVTEMWTQVKILDQGVRLGTSFFRFRNSVCSAKQVGPDPRHIQWADNDLADVAVSSLIADISIRHLFEECTDIPQNSRHDVVFELAPAHRKKYDKMVRDAMLELESGEYVNAVHAGALLQKCLQIASGAVYTGDGNYGVITSQRYDLIAQMVKDRPWPCVVFFQWKHQLEELRKAFERLELRHAAIHGGVTSSWRDTYINQFQGGFLDVIALHPDAAAHGLTLVNGRTTIWACPIREPGKFMQGNKRIHRIGQKHETETILITAANTVEDKVYATLSERTEGLLSMLDLLAGE